MALLIGANNVAAKEKDHDLRQQIRAERGLVQSLKMQLDAFAAGWVLVMPGGKRYAQDELILLAGRSREPTPAELWTYEELGRARTRLRLLERQTKSSSRPEELVADHEATDDLDFTML